MTRYDWDSESLCVSTNSHFFQYEKSDLKISLLLPNCNTLPHPATQTPPSHCNMLQQTHTTTSRAATRIPETKRRIVAEGCQIATHYHTLQHKHLSYCNTLQHTHTTISRTATLIPQTKRRLVANSCRIATHCNTLQHTATHYHTLQHKNHRLIYHLTATHTPPFHAPLSHCNTLQHTHQHLTYYHRTKTHCNTLQHTATHCITLQRTATHCNTHTTTPLTTTRVPKIQRRIVANRCQIATNHTPPCTTLQHTATHLQHSATPCNTLQHTYNTERYDVE